MMTEQNEFAESGRKGKISFVQRPDTPSPNECVINPTDFAHRISEAGRVRGFRCDTFAFIAGLPLVALTKRTPGPRPRIYLSAGIHGDEPAPPLALLELVEAGALDERATWFLCPLLNPAGFTCRTRENADGLDLNRDYKHLRSLEIQAHARWLARQPNFDLAICVHEDWEATGFYLYELNPTSRASVARRMIESVAPICPIDRALIIDGRPVAEPGIIRPVTDPLLRDPWPESIYLRAHHTRLAYTIESPSSRLLGVRIAALRAAICAAIATPIGGLRPDAAKVLNR